MLFERNVSYHSPGDSQDISVFVSRIFLEIILRVKCRLYFFVVDLIYGIGFFC